MELSPRLQAVADRIPRGARLIDVGTDHGYLPVWLLQHGIPAKVIASDLRSGPLEKAKAAAKRFAFEQLMEFRLCNGLEGIHPDEVDVISIAGMGGETIANILDAAPWTAQGSHQLILQPMSSLPELRFWLSTHYYTIIEETIVREGKTLYIIMKAAAGEMRTMTPAEIWAGRQDSGMDGALRAVLLDRLHHRALRARDGLRRSSREEDRQKLLEFELLAEELNQMKQEWSSWQQ